MVALTFSPTGTLYAMSSSTTDLYAVNLSSGHATVVFNTGFTASGDLAFETDGSLYLTTPTDLVKIDLSDDRATDVGPLGVPNIFGLAVDSNGQMYGADGESGGQGESGGSTATMFHINTKTGAATVIGPIPGVGSLGIGGLSFGYPLSAVATVTTLSASTVSAALGQPVTFTATVRDSSASGPTPNGGTVTFSDQNGALGSGTLVEGVATFATSSLPGGTNTITASYSGTADFGPSSAGTTVTVTGNPGIPIGPTAPTRTVLSAQPRPVNLGRRVSFTATVKTLNNRGTTPRGSITFMDGTVSLGTFAVRHGKASLRTSNLPLGPNLIKADYTPSQGFAPSTASLVEIVRAHPSKRKAAPAITIGGRAVPSTSMDIRYRKPRRW